MILAQSINFCFLALVSNLIDKCNNLDRKVTTDSENVFYDAVFMVLILTIRIVMDRIIFCVRISFGKYKLV